MLAALKANLLASVLGLLAAILLAVCLYQNVQIHGFLWLDGLNDKIENLRRDNNELRSELKRISDAKDKQGDTTKGNMEKVENGRKRSETIAKRIEAAPLPGNCATPKEIMGADL